MNQLNNLADNRLINGCIYCGGVAETRDHVPSRILIDRPYPENLPVVGSCKSCNQGFSLDEEYLVCLIESTIAGTTNPDKLRRPAVGRIMRNSPALQARIQGARREYEDRVEFAVEEERIQNVMLKLARGHAAFELSQLCKREPDHIWCGPLHLLPQKQREAFDAVHFQQMVGEIGSRGLQRMIVAQIDLQPVGGGKKMASQMLINDWVDVQDGNYRYIAIDDVGGVVIRIVISEYLACEVCWFDDPQHPNQGEQANQFLSALGS